MMAALRHTGAKIVLGRNPTGGLSRSLWCFILLSLAVLVVGCGTPDGQAQLPEPAGRVTEQASAPPREPSVSPTATAAAPSATVTLIPTPVSPTATQTIPPTAEEPVQTPFPTATPATTPLRSPTAALGSPLTAQDVQRITAADAKVLLDAGEAVLYDVRSVNEYARLHAAGARSFPESEAATRVDELPAAIALVFY
jgi:hypothetical protein